MDEWIIESALPTFSNQIMKANKIFLLLVFFGLSLSQLPGQNQPIPLDKLYIGADLSMTKAILDKGGIYYIDNQEVDVFNAFKERKYDYARLRLFHTSNGEMGTVNTLDYTIELAKTIKASGLKLLLDFHYSDWWADPSQQDKPAAWADLDFNTLNDSLYNYTKRVLNIFADNDIYPDLVQTGNEIHHGMLWDDGKLWVDDKSNWANFTTLLKSAIKGVRESSGGTEIPIMVHGFSSTDPQQAKRYIDSLMFYNVEFDLIGLSYYVCWHGTMNQLDNTLAFLDTNYEQDVIIAETNYNSDGTTPDWCVIDDSQLPFPYTEQGQYDYLQTIYALAKKYPGTKGLFYWGGELIWAEDIGGSYQSLFHWQGNANKALDAFYDLLPTEEIPYSTTSGFTIFKNKSNQIIVRSENNIAQNAQFVVYDQLGRIIKADNLKGIQTMIDIDQELSGLIVVGIIQNGIVIHRMKLVY